MNTEIITFGYTHSLIGQTLLLFMLFYLSKTISDMADYCNKKYTLYEDLININKRTIGIFQKLHHTAVQIYRDHILAFARPPSPQNYHAIN